MCTHIHTFTYMHTYTIKFITIITHCFKHSSHSQFIVPITINISTYIHSTQTNRQGRRCLPKCTLSTGGKEKEIDQIEYVHYTIIVMYIVMIFSDKSNKLNMFLSSNCEEKYVRGQNRASKQGKEFSIS
jgi:hypothetical protein